MKYVLLLGLTYKKFKKDCRITISTGKRTIDDVMLDDDIYEINPKDFESIIPPDDPVNYEQSGWKKIQDAKKFPNKMFQYELSGDEIEEDITLHLHIKDNNYNNGFMTKTAEVKIKFMYLFPKIALIKKKYHSMFYDWCKDLMIPKKRIVNLNEKQTIFYPGPHRIDVTDNNSGQQETYIGINACEGLFETSFGDVHTMKFHVLKTGKFVKLGTKDCTKHIVKPALLDIASVYGLINTHNEDQRSNHTKN
jgi:hypothetical protein